MYIILKHNPTLRPGKLTLHHIAFETDGEDEYGYPITKLDPQGNPIVKDVIPYEVPYLKSEIIAMINWLHDNRDTIPAKK
jgi:catechol 2,3-dioxygenase-like lactoylglutathione lyase family enzyme